MVQGHSSECAGRIPSDPERRSPVGMQGGTWKGPQKKNALGCIMSGPLY